MKCLQFLVHVFLDCKLSFACFDWNTVLSAGYGYHISPAMGTREFRFAICPVWQPAQIHIHVHLCLAGTSLYQRCLVADEILSAPNKPIHVSAGSEPCNVSVKHWKDCIYRKKENICLRTSVFQWASKCLQTKAFPIQTFSPSSLMTPYTSIA